MANDPLIDLVEQLYGEIIETLVEVAALRDELERADMRRDELGHELRALQAMADRKGLNLPAMPPLPWETREGAAEALEDWTDMSRVDAIERVLRESSEPMHLAEIEGVLLAHGRTNDGTESISATLAHIRKSRHTVASLGQGRWEYLRAGTNAAGFRNAFENLTATVADGALASGGEDDLARIVAGGDHPEKSEAATTLERALLDYQEDAPGQ